MATTTALPRGRGTKHRFGEQPDFLTPGSAAFSDWVEFNVYKSTLNKKKPFDDDDVLGVVGYANDVDARPAAPGVEDADGSMTVPLDLQQIGFHLKGLFGSAADAAYAGHAGFYTHGFTSGLSTIPARTLEKQLANGQFESMTSMIIRGATFEIGADKGYRTVDLDLVGRQVSDPYSTSIVPAVGAMPHGLLIQQLSARIPKAAGLLSIGGSQVGRVLSGSCKIAHTIDMDRYAGDRQQSEAYLLKTDVTWEITARYVSDALRSYGVGGADGFIPDPIGVSFSYNSTGFGGLSITGNAVRFEPVAAPTENGGAITIKLMGRSELAATTPMLSVSLVNQFPSYG